MQRGNVPAAPFIAILEKRIEQLERRNEEKRAMEILAFELGISDRNLYRIRNENVAEMSFDTADKIVTRLLGPMAWHTDEELREIYLNADLRSLDWSYPTSDGVRKQLATKAQKVLEKAGSGRAAAEELGVSRTAFGRMLEVAA